eukprot:m.35066 g.35066  ORF g.35066 m.35066 type:complete len:109 (+) comp32059_c0_seq3:57-383(+)
MLSDDSLEQVSLGSSSSSRLGGGVSSGSVNDYFFKFLVIGDVCVGKTSFVDQYVYGKPFNASYKTTIGVDFAVKNLKWSETERIRVQVSTVATMGTGYRSQNCLLHSL